jgi:hypothetical protein
MAVFDSAGGVSSDGSPRASLQILSNTGVLAWDVPLPDGFRVTPGFGNLAWSPDAGSLAITGITKPGLIDGVQPTTLFIADTADQTLRPLTGQDNSFVYGPGWASDGSLYIARSSFDDTSISRIDASNGQETLIVRTQPDSCAQQGKCSFDRLGSLVPSPDGTKLAYRDTADVLSVIDIATRATTPIPPTLTASFTPYEWSEEGTALLFFGYPGPPASAAVPTFLAQFELASRSSTVLLRDVRAFDFVPTTP